jgi:hypothetical protein
LEGIAFMSEGFILGTLALPDTALRMPPSPFTQIIHLIANHERPEEKDFSASKNP